MSAGSRGKLIEGLSVLVIVASIVALGIPKWTDLQRRDDARRILADVALVREAVYRFYSDSAAFPREAPGGQFSDDLTLYLPPTFHRTRPYGTIEYRNWPMSAPDSLATDRRIGGSTDGDPANSNPPGSHPTASNVIAVGIVPRDPKVAAAASALAYEMPQFTMGNKFFFVLFGT